MVVVVGACAGSRSLQPAQIDTASYTAICVCASTSSTQESVNGKKNSFISSLRQNPRSVGQVGAPEESRKVRLRLNELRMSQVSLELELFLR